MSFVSFICIFRVCNLCKFIQGQYYSKTFNSSASCSRSLIECVKIVNAIDERKPVFNSFFFLTLSVLMDRTIHFCINWFLLLLFLRKVKVISILFFTLILFSAQKIESFFLWFTEYIRKISLCTAFP